MNKEFGLITEGPTDQVVIKHLLAKYFSNPDIDTRPVQPNKDATDIRAHFGGWGRVLEYCQSPDMAKALQMFDFVIIQIDTDVCEEYGVSRRDGGEDCTDEQIILKTKNVIIQKIGPELFNLYKGKIIFAISYESIECWLLPLYFNDHSRAKTKNCCEKLNQGLPKGGFTIDCNNKKPKYYEIICKNIRNKHQIDQISVHNNSFNHFVRTLAALSQ